MIDWMKYAEIQILKREGVKKARVARILRINRETVAKYWEKSPDIFGIDFLLLPGCTATAINQIWILLIKFSNVKYPCVSPNTREFL